jgi:F-type H+-transporting ATPase subunit delta
LSNQDVASRRYATALLDVATAANAADRCLADLEVFARQVERAPELRELFANPTVPAESVGKVVHALTDAMKLDPMTASFLSLLASRRRLDRLSSVIAAYKAAQDDRAGLARAELESAGPIPDAHVERIRDAIGAAMNRRLVVTRKTDPALLSGVRVTVGDRVFDLSARTYLESLRSRLLENR